ncbi:acyl-CoA dehydrogenase family protein [Halomonas sp. M5N1S17]|uniref:acyl-CoA dehydrogenase family protein n=1 Tax=Halomonas alkalisoli TaxID=2907158 RepID=UPI001F40F2A0|nr:acyl-CoA dehydrogenase family protein [Halomonas alkalisoli]MCE9662306.1 acyl-CoA dehydrogenase family protein [Halomonas alkalisoli]
MNFAYSDEQRMLADTLERLVADQAPTETDALHGEPSPLWGTFAELGLLQLPFTEEAGGLGGDGIDVMIVMQALGRGLVREPYLAGLLLPGTLLARLADAPQRERWLAPLLEGELRLALAWQETAARYDAHAIATCARRQADGWIIEGAKQVVIAAPSATALLVSARVDDGTLGVFLVPADSPGLERRDYPTLDDQIASDVQLKGVALPHDARLGEDAAEALAEVLALGRAALCAEAVGAMEAACDQTLAYLKERRQFGTPLASFQVLQHRMVDMHLNLEQARSMAILAAASLERPSDERDYRVAAAKAYCGEAARFVAEQAIQLHGAMGMTEECRISHYARHLVMFDHHLGDVDHHLEFVSEGLSAA